MRRLLTLAVALFLVVPLLVTPRMWVLRGPYRAAGIALAAAIALLYWLGRGRAPLLSPDGRGFRLRAADTLLLVAFPVYLIAMGNAALVSNADNRVTRVLGLLVLEEHTLDLSHATRFGVEGDHYSTIRVGDRLLPSFPLGTGLLSTPYVGLGLLASGGEASPRHLNRWEKHLSALLAGAAAAALFMGARRAFGETAAGGATLVFALGTTTLSSVSQALWSTTGEVFFLCLALCALMPAEQRPGRLLAGGLALGAAFLCRPTALMATGIIVTIVALRRRRDLVWLLPAVGITIGTVVVFHLWVYGHPLGGYGLMNRHVWNAAPWVGLAGNLVSPSRGLLTHFPYLAIALLGWRAGLGDRDLRLWTLGSLAAAGATYLAASLYVKWWGGWSIGPRLMTEAAPFLALLTIPAWLSLRSRPWWRVPFLLAVVFSVGTQLLSVYTARGEQWNRRVQVDQNPSALWWVGKSQLVALWCPTCSIPSAPPTSTR